MRCAARRGAVLQHIEPPCVVIAHDAEMVGNDVDDEPHAMLVQRPDQTIEVLARAQLRIELGVIDDVVAVHAARAAP